MFFYIETFYMFGIDAKLALAMGSVLLILTIIVIVLIVRSNKSVKEEFKGGLKRKTVIFFHMTGCSFCTEMMPEWDKFHKAHRSDPDIDVVKTNAAESPVTVEKLGISGYPAVILFDKGRYIEFSGPRTHQGFEEFIKKTPTKNWKPIPK